MARVEIQVVLGSLPSNGASLCLCVEVDLCQCIEGASRSCQAIRQGLQLVQASSTHHHRCTPTQRHKEAPFEVKLPRRGGGGERPAGAKVLWAASGAKTRRKHV